MSTSPASTPPESNVPALSPDDVRVLDLLAEHGFDPEIVATLEPADSARGAAILGMLRNLEAYPVSSADDSLVDATLARIDRHDAETQAKFRLVGQEHADTSEARWGFRWADLLTLAAVLLIAASILTPVAHNVRARSQQTACAANLASLGGALSSYTNDNGGLLPAIGQQLRLNLGGNCGNLSPLLDGQYCSDQHFNCPGHSGEGCGYSYRVLLFPATARLDVIPSLALMADRNPAADRAMAGFVVRDFRDPSANHAGRGQQVLFGNLEVRWTTSPLIVGPSGEFDNLWLLTITGDGEGLHRDAIPSVPEHFVTQ